MSAAPPDCTELQAEYDGLIYAISHDLRAPVRAVTGFAQVLREQLEAQTNSPLQGDTLRFMARIESSTQRLHQMLDALLLLSRLSQQPLRLQTTALKPLCEQVIAQLPEEQQRLVMLNMPDDLCADVDTTLMSTAISALLDNALKFCNTTTTPAVQLDGSASATHTRLTVSDNGPGFDMQYVSRLGVPFQHLHTNTSLQGVGIGLASVRRIIARHGGTFRAEGALGTGSKFHLHWPRV
jgi:signal transduction histidine kinase